MADDAYEFRIHLSDGQTVTADVTADDLDRLTANNPRYVVPAADRADPLRAASTLLYSMLLHRVDRRVGETAVRDREGRNWILPASSIVAFSYRAPDGPTRPELGSITPTAARDKYSSS